MATLSPGALARRVRRRLLPTPAAPVRPAATSEHPPPVPRCLVCRSTKLRERVVVNRRSQRRMTVVLCGRCRYVSLPDNTHDYLGAKTPNDLAGATSIRLGTMETPGRETAMAELALQALRRQNASVLVYGAGQTLDALHIAKLPRCGRVAIGDMVQTRDDTDFVDITQPATEPFDVVIASEVLEHFPLPRRNFANLFSYVKDDGIIIASTNIRDDLPIGKVSYIWARGHVSYYSPKALRVIARRQGMHLDFRAPLIAAGSAGPRKRYVIFSRSSEVMDAVADWFGGHLFAPSGQTET